MSVRQVLRASYLAAVASWIAMGLGAAQAAPLVPGDILVSDEVFGGNGRIREFTPAGVLVQTFTFPTAPGDGQPRGIAVDSNGNIQIYNGTFHPVLTTLDPATGAVVRNTAFPGWSTINNTTYGGVGAFGNSVFVTTTATGVSSDRGLIRFNVNDFSGIRFGSNDYIQLAVGKDGLLYAQTPPTSPGGFQLDVYDPTTLAFLRQIDLGQDLRSIAVDQNGDIFATNINDPNIYEFDPNGVLLRTLTTSIRGLSEIELDDSGRLVAASGGTLVVTDTSLSGFTTLDVGTISPVDTFIAFVEPPRGLAVPEPSSLTLVGLAIPGLAGYAWRRRKRHA
jgi:sugar lactone lactonase YvrE